MLFEQVLLNQLLDTFDLFANSNQLHWTFLLITSQFHYSIKELKYCNSLDVNTAFLTFLMLKTLKRISTVNQNIAVLQLK